MSSQRPRFFLDETSFKLEEDQLFSNGKKLFEDLVEFVDRHLKEQRRSCWSEIYYERIHTNLLLYDLLYPPKQEENEAQDEGEGEETPLDESRKKLQQFVESFDHDVRQALQLLIDRCAKWDESLPEEETKRITELLVSFGKHPERKAPTIAFAYEQAAQNRAVSCLGLILEPTQTGAQPVTIQDKEQLIHFVSTEPQLRTFYRYIPETEDLDERSYIEHAALAFPSLHFVPGIENQFRRFSQAFREIRSEVTRHLSALNDHFKAVFESHSYAPDPTKKEMSAKCSVDMSPESTQTKKNKAAWEERKIVLLGKELYCEWHTKISPTKDRIHFHPGSPGVVDGKIIVGIFAEHLAT